MTCHHICRLDTHCCTSWHAVKQENRFNHIYHQYDHVPKKNFYKKNFVSDIQKHMQQFFISVHVDKPGRMDLWPDAYT